MEKSFPHYGKTLTRENLLPLLRATDADLSALYARADAVRRENCGDAVPIRAILEFSNVCANDCLYCGIRASNPDPIRYQMAAADIRAAARQIAGEEIAGTIVLQAGETPGASDDAIAALIRDIKTDCPALAITLSVGNRPRHVYARWRDAGMDRYLLRFETSDAALFARLHPAGTLAERLRCLRDLQALGVQTGGGFMIGLPGETVETLADNILLCREFDFDMIGIGPYIPHPGTPLSHAPNVYADDPDMFFRAIAVLRLATPLAHIPATTAFDALFSDGRDRALQCGANVFMPNATPRPYRRAYQLYPGKPCIDEEALDCSRCVQHRLHTLGRPIAPGPSHSLKMKSDSHVLNPDS
ncbi:MAG: [FeFe] hydrogenase H-cluster radical SAM maturase HydE [Kiritimatiellia bacterium]|jgi:biotin synthase|nr:[FeFe] hydrogenase H-cluster radical SAM maturase HydE [Kiritimatiellia bacterium]